MRNFVIISGVLVALVNAFLLGMHVGESSARERFYEKCRGGEVSFGPPDGSGELAIGCAEIARRMR